MRTEEPRSLLNNPGSAAAVRGWTGDLTFYVLVVFINLALNITSLSGVKIPWVDNMRYLGVFIVQYRLLKCSLDNAKKAFYRCANAVFGKIGRIASEEVTHEIIRCKCIPVLLYGTEACLQV